MTLLAIIEVFLILFLAQVVHVLTKMETVKQRCKAANVIFKAKIFLDDNMLVFFINGILIFLFGYMVVMSNLPMKLDAFAEAGAWYFPIIKYVLYFGSGYFIQSLFNFILGLFLKKSGVKISDGEKVDGVSTDV